MNVSSISPISTPWAGALGHHTVPLNREFFAYSCALKIIFSDRSDDGVVITHIRRNAQRWLSAAPFDVFHQHSRTKTQAPAIPAPLARTEIRPQISIELGRYQVRLAASLAERDAACRLRFNVFNLELGEGLQSSYSTGLDRDAFDLFCDHLIVEDRSAREIVGTYRMQSGDNAARQLGYYSAQEFDFAPYERIRSQVLELGRASIERSHRTSEVLSLLWRGIAQYSQAHGLRYLVGCSSMNLKDSLGNLKDAGGLHQGAAGDSQDPQTGWAMYQELIPFLVASPFRTRPTPPYALPPRTNLPLATPKVPKLLKTYIAVGARICGAPAWDREFGTIDFLTLLDLEQLTPAARNRFLSEPR